LISDLEFLEGVEMTKTYPKTKRGTCKVTFEVPPGAAAKDAVLVGDFNNWDPNATPMKRKRDGSFSIALTLEAGREYRFRYLLDGERWENDPQPDRFEPNVFGTQNSVVLT
jgi:1,4-alpha-glucan branching enzyme